MLTQGALGEQLLLTWTIALIAIAGFQAFGKTVDNKIEEQSAKVGQIGS